MRAPGAQVVIGDGAAAGIVFQSGRPGGRYQVAVASAQRLLQFFCHYPERPIELNVAVYASDRAGMAAFAFGSTSWQTPFQQILLATIEH